MKKGKKKLPCRSNPEAKYAREFNKAVKHRDRKHDYKRQPKHKGNADALDD